MDDKQHRHLEEVLKKLQAYIANSSPVISIYLRNNSNLPGSKLAEKFKNLIKENVRDYDSQIFKQQIETIDAYLTNDYDNKNHGTGIAFFAGNGVWEIANHNFSINDQCLLSQAPNIQPLVDELRKEVNYLFVLVDREKAKIFMTSNGMVESYREIYDPSVPQEVKAIKEYLGRDDHIYGHIQDHMNRHLKLISGEIDKFVKDKQIFGVYIGGHKQMFHEIREHLNPSLQKKIIGEFVIEVGLPKNEIISKSLEAVGELTGQT